MKKDYRVDAWYLDDGVLLEGYTNKYGFHPKDDIPCGFSRQKFSKKDINRVIFYNLEKAIEIAKPSAVIKEIICRYCRDLGRKMNRSLLNGDFNKYSKEINELKSVISKEKPLEEDMVVFRYVNDTEMNAIINAGDIYTFPIFVSTTIHKFKDGYFGRLNILELKLPKGTSCINAEPIVHRGDGEYILPCNSRILIHDISNHKHLKKCIATLII